MTVLPLGSEQRLELFKVGNGHILSGFYQTSYELVFLIGFGSKGEICIMKNVRRVYQMSGSNAFFKALKKEVLDVFNQGCVFNIHIQYKAYHTYHLLST